MYRELFRLSPDEAALVQLFRTLPTDSKRAILMMAEQQSADTSGTKTGNVMPFPAMRSK